MVSRIDASRTMAADPASVALLLSGPAAAETWPAGRGHSLSASPPTRFGAGYGLRLEIRSDDDVIGTARLSVQPSAHVNGHLQCELRMTIACDDAVTAVVALEQASYLDQIVVLAESRATAA
jgi:hypothetical protein